MKNMRPLRAWRILELADRPTFKRLLAEQTTYFFTGRGDSPAQRPRTGRTLFRAKADEAGRLTWRALLKLRRALRQGNYDLLALGAIQKPNWSKQRSWLSNVAHLIGTAARKPRLFAIYLAADARRCLVIDRRDEPTIADDNFWLLRRCALCFKRELPQNHWNVLLHATARDTDIGHLEKQRVARQAIARLRPLPLPVFIAPESFREISEKTADVFYAGGESSATLRASGLRALERLRARGYAVDLAERLPHEEFLGRCARAWLVWSPEGQGWQCWRHFEAVLMGSVPVINYRAINCYKPFIDREHCFYYAPEDDGLERTIAAALSDKPRLRDMAAAAQEHLRRFYSREAMIEYFERELSVVANEQVVR